MTRVPFYRTPCDSRAMRRVTYGPRQGPVRTPCERGKQVVRGFARSAHVINTRVVAKERREPWREAEMATATPGTSRCSKASEPCCEGASGQDQRMR